MRRLAAILFADVVGYSHLMERNEADTLKQIRAVRRTIVDPAFRSCRGRIVKTTGDGFLAEFASTVEAVHCAAHIQRAMAGRNEALPDAGRISLRIGLHQGDILGDGEDIFGDDVNIAARLEALCEPGGLCVSARVHEDLQGRLDLPFVSRGEQPIKNIARPVHVYGLSREAISNLALPPLGEARSAQAGPPTRRRRSAWMALTALGLILATSLAGWAGRVWFLPATAAADARGPRVAVLAFDNLSGESALSAFADGISEQLIADLAAFGFYDVLARNTTFVYRGQAVDVPAIGRKLGADYVVEGSARRVGDKLSVTAQLIETATGGHVWAQTFEDGSSNNPGEVQDRLARRIAVAVADLSAGAIAMNDYARNRNKPAELLSPYSCLAAHKQHTSEPGQIARVRTCLEAAVKRDPGNAEAWSSLSQLLALQRWYGFDLPPAEADDIDKRAYLVPQIVDAARRSAELAPDKSFAHFGLAKAYYVACQRDRLRVEAERVVALNPGDTDAMGPLGNWLAFSGDWDYGRRLADQAIALAGPSAPSWWGWAKAKDYYRQGDYAEAYKSFLQSYADGSWLDLLHVIYTLPYLGRLDEAKAKIPELLKLKPDMSIDVANQYYRMWCFEDDFIARMEVALRMAGLRESRGRP